MKVTTNFFLQEFVSSDLYSKWGDKSIWFLDKRIFTLAQYIRERHGKSMMINDPKYDLNYRGFREPAYRGGGKLSQHRFGRAIDFNVSGMTIQEVYEDMVKNFDMYSKAGLTTLEDIADTTTTKGGWVHADIRNWDDNELHIVKP